ncbi:chitotriosidase-1 [Penicillium argentinense]|uniref:chitinase n=1 Tax=Penicillium argentinense TaxID=1131581 RepID=A0A9W9G0T7_9EURO|nr:chitotriosidase-1 [Penicillium argentinense]KAJ5110014.1 chitotriosidase-1 [Penicillium argentinense]
MHAVVVSSEARKALVDSDQIIVVMTATLSAMQKLNVGSMQQKECPLNVCCSSFGHRGTTAEFCGDNCQKDSGNCEEHPNPPKGASPIPVLKNKVIGYYQSWAERRSCHTFPPDSIPVEGLTHLNYAFAYIDPDSLEVTVMDDQTPECSFSRTTDIKNTRSRNSELQIFASLGGWTFSDNDTATQPVFSDIAADAGKGLKFANNLLSFMVHYGFDGVDLDWEYPGAGDRGGNKDDVKNYVLLMKTIREKFDSSARVNYELSFTIPTSYWYLRWFDVPGLLKYADWVNMMSYDLHGVWDQNNPIGNKVHPHTNLTEIKSASGLLWRNDVAPSKVVIGIGFYGRSFHLKDKNCTTPGCDFHGDAQKGDCTKSSGTLATSSRRNTKNVTYDHDAAVKWITYGDGLDNWVSYDDAKTLKQKVDYADEVGLGGLMI